MVELVIFDMDGLMLDTETIAMEAWRRALADDGFDFPRELLSRMIGRDTESDRKLTTAHYGESFNFEAAQQRQSDYWEAIVEESGIATKKGLLHMLDFLDENGFKKCIATSTAKARMERKLTIAGVMDRFEVFVSGDQVENGKPAPDIFLKAAKAMGVEPKNCVVLEDSMAGVTAGHSAGMRVIVIPDLAEPDEETLAKAYAKCKDLEEAAELLAKGIL